MMYQNFPILGDPVACYLMFAVQRKAKKDCLDLSNSVIFGTSSIHYGVHLIKILDW